MPGQTLIVPLDMLHVMKKLGPLSSLSQTSLHSTHNLNSPPSHATIISHAPSPSHHPSLTAFSPPVQTTTSPHHPPLSHTPLVTPPTSLSSMVSQLPVSPSPIVLPPAYPQTTNSALLPNQSLSQTSFVQYSSNFQTPAHPANSPTQPSFPTYAATAYPPSSFASTSATTSSSYPSTPHLQHYPATTSNSQNAYTTASTYTAVSNFNFSNTPPYNSIYTPSPGFTSPNASYSPSTYPNPSLVTYPQATPQISTLPNTYNFLAQPTYSTPSITRSGFSTTFQKATTYNPPSHSTFSSTSYTTYSSPTKNPAVISKPPHFPLSYPPTTSHTKITPPSPTLLATPSFAENYNSVSTSLTSPPNLIPQQFPNEENKEKKGEEMKQENTSELGLSLSSIAHNSMELEADQPSPSPTPSSALTPSVANTKDDESQPEQESYTLTQTTQAGPTADVISDEHTHAHEAPIQETPQTTESTVTNDPTQINETPQSDQIHTPSLYTVPKPVLVENSNGPSKEVKTTTLTVETNMSAKTSFPTPLLTYSGECSFVGTTRESFARNVDLMKYWHQQLRKDHQPASVHVDLAIYCLISYVVTAPNALHENQILIEHFIGAIPHFKEFVADEVERVNRYQGKYSNALHTLLKKESRLEWVCRKCHCQLTNFLIRLSTKNDASCFECWEEEQEGENKKEDKKRKKEKGKKATTKGEGTFRFGTVESLIALSAKAAKIVNKLNNM